MNETQDLIEKIRNGVATSLNKTQSRKIISEVLKIPLSKINGNVRLIMNGGVYLYEDECKRGLKDGYYFIAMTNVTSKKYSNDKGLQIYHFLSLDFLRYEDKSVNLRNQDRFLFYLKDAALKFESLKIPVKNKTQTVSSQEVNTEDLNKMFGKQPEDGQDLLLQQSNSQSNSQSVLKDSDVFTLEDYLTKESLEGDNKKYQDLTARDRVCIELKVPLSSKQWVNSLIRESLEREEIRKNNSKIKLHVTTSEEI